MVVCIGNLILDHFTSAVYYKALMLYSIDIKILFLQMYMIIQTT